MLIQHKHFLTKKLLHQTCASNSGKSGVRCNVMMMKIIYDHDDGDDDDDDRVEFTSQ